MRTVGVHAHDSAAAAPAAALSVDAAAAVRRPSVSVIVPAFNEGDILIENLTKLCDYLARLENEYVWEVVVVNDGSTDDTGAQADAFAQVRPHVRVLHHHTNFRLGQALRYAFGTCRSDYVVTLDCDLSYAPDHIGRMLTELRTSRARVVIASPYTRHGQTTRIPALRRLLSRSANRFLAATARGRLSTLTGMVRAYDRRFLSTLNLRAMGTDINTEILYKAELLGAKVVEIPAHLDWTSARARGRRRTSWRALLSSANAYLFSGFMFRPVLFFIGPGLIVLSLAAYTLAWVVYRVGIQYAAQVEGSVSARITNAIQLSYEAAPYGFIVGGVALMIAFQLISLGILAMQSERYFKELFHFNTTLLRQLKHPDGTDR